MDLFSLKEFTIETIKSLIENEVEENVHLDYKDGKALQTNDKGKNEITKDVSSFANSDGVIIVYGVTEKNHIPTVISTCDGNAFTKERLDQIISNIQPHIKGVKIYPIRVEGDISRSIYVVKIPEVLLRPIWRPIINITNAIIFNLLLWRITKYEIFSFVLNVRSWKSMNANATV